MGFSSAVFPLRSETRLMPANIGQIVRIVGLLMEMFGLAAVALGGRDGGRSLFGMTSNQVWSIVAVGFAFWLTGTILIFQEAARRREDAEDE
ncbi:hypothetical protein [Paludisphaera rhizosphaerae]|uniref:hypothetical protein n=2 Tax=Paludisphaera rhizosphaerae TaxID=2711216 RepID=UPI0013EDDBDC|nr:hypothetical protein [Paludisphaera rhizosphaerae]